MELVNEIIRIKKELDFQKSFVNNTPINNGFSNEDKFAFKKDPIFWKRLKHLYIRSANKNIKNIKEKIKTIRLKTFLLEFLFIDKLPQEKILHNKYMTKIIEKIDNKNWMGKAIESNFKKE